MKKIIPLIMLAVSASFAVKIGVMAPFGGTVCRSYGGEYLAIILDMEDSKNKSSVTGDPYPIGFRLADGNAYFSLCKMDDWYLKKVPYDYVVFRMDYACPSGGIKFRRHHDSEDDRNKNGTLYGSPSPTLINDNADMEFCLMPGTTGARNEFPLDGEFGVYANYVSNTVAHSIVRIDDENSKNRNSWNWYGRDKDKTFQTRVKRIVNDADKDTYYHMIRKLPLLAKKTSETEAGVDNNAFVNKSATTDVRGFDHSTVSFELKSAGNAVITIANVNGAVVSRISKENLEPGAHSVEWHSGVLPNGLYIVTIKHNGTVSSKGFVLK